MMLLVRYCLILVFIFSLPAGISFAEEWEEEKVEQLRIVQEQQKLLLKEYNHQIQELHDSFKDQIEELGIKETTDRRRNQIITELNAAELDLKNSFQQKMNSLQQEEKALRAMKKEPDVVVLTPEVSRPLTPEEKLKAAEERRLELEKKLAEAREARAEPEKKRKKREGSIGKNLRSEDKALKKRFERIKKESRRKKDQDIKFNQNFNLDMDSTKGISDIRREQKRRKDRRNP